MRVLIACEFSGIVRDAFLRRGYDAWSCDLVPTESTWPEDRHIIGDVRDLLGDGWDLMIAHPPCTHLAVSGARWFKHKRQEQAEALEFVRLLMDAPIPHVAIENPVSIISSHVRKPEQIIQPWQFGHLEMKTTCLWLSGLSRLKHTNVVGPPPVKGSEDRKLWERVWRMPPTGWNGDSNRARERSRTYSGIAEAMAEQWGPAVTAQMAFDALEATA